MRLDFSNVGKGLVAIAEAKKARDLARESERYNVTEGAYGEGLQTNIQQVEQMRDQALRDAAARQGTMQDLEAIRAQYDPSIVELQRRAGLTAPDFSIASGQQTFGTREEATRAARPMRAEGLARVYERFGDIDQAEAMRERAEAGRFRDLQMRGLERTDRQAAVVEAVDADTSKWLTARLTNEDGTVRAPTAEDTVAAIQHRAALFQQKGLGDQAAAALQQHASIAANQIQLQTAQRNQALSVVAAGIASGDFAAAKDFYDQFIPDGAKVTDIKEGRNGRITISRTTLDGTKLPDSSFANRNEMLAALNSVRDPMSLYNYAQQEFENNIKLRTLKATEARLAQENKSGNLIQVEDADGKLRLLDTSRLPRDESGQPILPDGVRKVGTKETSPLNRQQQLAYDVLKTTEAFKEAMARGNQPALREMLTKAGIPPEAILGGQAEPPGGGGFTPAAATTPAVATPEPGLVRETPPAPQARQMTLLEAFGINNPNSALARTAAPKIAAVQAAADEVKAAQARSIAANRSGDPRAMGIAVEDMRQQQQKLDRLLANDPNAQRVRRALGL